MLFNFKLRECSNFIWIVVDSIWWHLKCIENVFELYIEYNPKDRSNYLLLKVNKTSFKLESIYKWE